MNRQAPLLIPVVRYVVTHINKDGYRALIDPMQGRYTCATPEEAQCRLDAIMAVNSKTKLEEFFGLPLEVRPCNCYPNHFDPIGGYFE